MTEPKACPLCRGAFSGLFSNRKKKTCWSCQTTACSKCVLPFFSADLLWTKPQDVCPSCTASLQNKVKRIAEAASRPREAVVKEKDKEKEAAESDKAISNAPVDKEKAVVVEKEAVKEAAKEAAKTVAAEEKIVETMVATVVAREPDKATAKEPEKIIVPEKVVTAVVETANEHDEVAAKVALPEQVVLPEKVGVPEKEGVPEAVAEKQPEKVIQVKPEKKIVAEVAAAKEPEKIVLKEPGKMAQKTPSAAPPPPPPPVDGVAKVPEVVKEPEKIDVEGSAPSTTAARRRPPARGSTSRANVKQQAKEAAELREREEAELQRVLDESALPEPEVPAPEKVVAAGGSVADRRKSLAAALPAGLVFGGAPPPRRPSVASPDEGRETRGPVATHGGQQFGLGLGALSGGLGSLRKRQPSSEPAPTVPAPEEKPEIVKPSQLRAAAAAAASSSGQIKTMMAAALSDLDRAEARRSMSDNAPNDDEQVRRSPRAAELDGLIAEARQAVATPPIVTAPEVPEAAPEKQPKKTHLETISPYDTSPSQSPRRSGAEEKPAAAVHKNVLAHLKYEHAPSPQASRNSMHCVEVGEEGDSDSSTGD